MSNAARRARPKVEKPVKDAARETVDAQNQLEKGTSAGEKTGNTVDASSQLRKRTTAGDREGDRVVEHDV
ncbi:hypothetical protein PsorP6_014949 [Peronosclerospora sorghi]|uniref:Uncharacterized protein n=1 Tax=Peronosclerospora sorghi TaxID=230839 RepID=A0ACC0VRE6_9STRA|nr:hypothetical protein PsorP6_014949 [Peronosclerospora sorghi]